MALRAFPVIYARDVEAVAAFYARLGFREGFRMNAQDGSAGFIRLEREGVELGVTTEDSPRMLAGIQPGSGPRHELFVYVADVDEMVAALTKSGTKVVREPADMFWGERLAYVADPEGNLVVLAGVGAT
jgi:lactoylglutathione lyase